MPYCIDCGQTIQHGNLRCRYCSHDGARLARGLQHPIAKAIVAVVLVALIAYEILKWIFGLGVSLARGITHVGFELFAHPIVAVILASLAIAVYLVLRWAATV